MCELVEGGMMRMKSLIAVCALFTFALAACTSTGVQVDEKALTNFQKGKTSVGDVIAQLGQPTTNMLMDNGQRIIMYTYAQSQARPETFIPLIGPLVGGADVRTSNVMLTFDRNGLLQSYSSSQSQFGSGTGLASGVSQGDRVRPTSER
jgi:outer membrane protein assembly factor BamE (lipoprotein component of BamABCDE complex)